MKKLCLCFLLLFATYALGQNKEWVTFNSTNSKLPSNQINGIAIDSFGVKWVVAEKGLVKIDGNDFTIYDKTNSALTCPHPLAVAIEGQNTVWIATYCLGLVKFDGKDWAIYDSIRSPLPFRTVTSVVIDKQGNKWAGMVYGGAAKFDGTNWTFYNTANSPLPSNHVNCIAVNSLDMKFFGTDNGLAVFDGKNWIVYNKDNSPIPGNNVQSVTFDKDGIMWVGTKGQGLVRHDGVNCDIYNILNSELKNNYVHAIHIDSHNQIWVGTETGLAKINASVWTCMDTLNSSIAGDYITSIVSDKSGSKWIGTFNRGISVYTELQSGVNEDKSVIYSYSLRQNYPNPFNPSTTISYSIPKEEFVSLKVYNLLGSEVAALVNEVKSSGNHSLEFNASSLPSGIYIYTIQAGGFMDGRKLVLLK